MKKIDVSPQRFDQSPHNIVIYCALLTTKILKFQKSKMAAAAILEKLKNSNISATVWPTALQFGIKMQFEPLHPSDR